MVAARVCGDSSVNIGHLLGLARVGHLSKAGLKRVSSRPDLGSASPGFEPCVAYVNHREAEPSRNEKVVARKSGVAGSIVREHARVDRGEHRRLPWVGCVDHGDAQPACYVEQSTRTGPPEPEDEAVGRSADERGGRLLVGHPHLIDREQQVARLQHATGERKASHLPEDDRRACVAAPDEIDADRRAARRLGQLDDHDVAVTLGGARVDKDVAAAVATEHARVDRGHPLGRTRVGHVDHREAEPSRNKGGSAVHRHRPGTLFRENAGVHIFQVLGLGRVTHVDDTQAIAAGDVRD